jgi:hypothetical protein
MKKVRNRAKLISTELGGLCCRPMALRINENTTTSRVKEVTIISKEGATLNTVTTIIICTILPDTLPSSATFREKLAAITWLEGISNIRLTSRALNAG